MNSNRSGLGGSELPTPYGPLLDAISFIALDVVQWLPLNCAYEDGFSSWDALLTVTLMPIGGFFMVLGATVTHELSKRRRGHLARTPKEVLEKPLARFMMCMLLILPTVSQRICNSFRCTTYSGGNGQLVSLLNIDLRVDCYSGHYNQITTYGTVMIFGELGLKAAQPVYSGSANSQQPTATV